MPKPSEKSEEIEQLLKKTFGFDRRDYITKGLCVPTPVGCGLKVDFELMNEEEKREYSISGLCKRCQDSFFKSLKPKRA